MKTQTRILMVVDEAGCLVGTAYAGEEAKGEGPMTSICALPGQTVHEVTLPEELEPLLKGSVTEFHQALSGYQLYAGPAQSLLVPTTPPAESKE